MTRSQTAARGVLRAVLVATAIFHFGTGDIPYAVFGLGGIALALVPEILARTRRVQIPFELELVLLVVLVADMTLGRLARFYELLPWYDKLLHGGASFLIAMNAFLVVYVLHFIGHTRRHFWIDAATIFLVTLGLGAVWEIGEYVVDRVFHRMTQGSPDLSALDDTMFDLILDGAGGILAAVLGPLYIRWSTRSRRQVAAFTELMEPRPSRRAPDVLAGHVSLGLDRPPRPTASRTNADASP